MELGYGSALDGSKEERKDGSKLTYPTDLDRRPSARSDRRVHSTSNGTAK